MKDISNIGKVTKNALSRNSLESLAIFRLLKNYPIENSGVSSIIVKNLSYDDRLKIIRYFKLYDKFTSWYEIDRRTFQITFWFE